MKRSVTRVAVAMVCAACLCLSCLDDKSVIGDDFAMPRMTDENTIQFTVEALPDNREIGIYASGGRMAIDWGDGRLQKIEDPGQETVYYTYGNCKKYRVRVWAEELEYCSVGASLLPVSELRVGHLPRMRTLYLDSFSSTTELNVGESCPNVEELGIYRMADLERINMEECGQLKTLTVNDLPKLSTLDIGNKPALKELNCYFCDIASLSLTGAPRLRKIECMEDSNLSRMEFAEDTDVGTLIVSGCGFTDMSFLERLPSLTELDCSYNQLTELNLSDRFVMSHVNCGYNRLRRLDIGGTLIFSLRCNDNDLDAQALNDMFDDLPTVVQSEYADYVLSYGNNPGTGTCRYEIPLNKGWLVE